MSAPIVVGLDPFRRERNAAVLAARLARHTGAAVVALTHYQRDRISAAVTGGMSENFATDAARERIADVAGAFVGVQLESRIAAGRSPAATLHEAAEELGAGLIVVGSSHRGAVGRALAGSTTERVLYGSPCPVAVAPAGYEDADGAPRKIDVAYIETEEGREALAAGVALARRWDADLRIVTVVEPIAWMRGVQGPSDAQRTRDEALRLAGSVVDRAVAEVEGVRASGEVIYDPAASGIHRATGDCDLVICGSRGYGPLKTILLGGVSHLLVRAAACPVIVVPRGTERQLETLVVGARDAVSS